MLFGKVSRIMNSLRFRVEREKGTGYSHGMNPPKVIGLVALTDKPGMAEALRIMRRELSRHGLASCMIDSAEKLETSIPQCDLLVTFGGDGTMLTVSSLAAMHGVPLAGVNLGRLGFMTTCSVHEVPLLAYALHEGTFLTDERSMLEVVRRGAHGELLPGRKLALNEVSLLRAQTGKMVDLDAEIDGELLNRYHADGVLVSTPTGSTAYSLSAGGPLVWPMSQVVCVTPICPHSLTNRSVVLPDSMTICLRPRERRGRSDAMVYSLDGRSAYPIEVGESLVIRKAPETLSLVHFKPQHFGALLRAKLRWQGAEIPTDDD